MILCERFHWTLDEVDALDLTEYRELLAILDGLDKARAYKRDRR